MELKDLKVKDVLTSSMYEAELIKQMEIEETMQTRAIRQGVTRRTVLDRLRARNVWKSDALLLLYVRILDKSLTGYSAAERKFINDVCWLAYRRTMRKAMREEQEGLNEMKE